MGNFLYILLIILIALIFFLLKGEKKYNPREINKLIELGELNKAKNILQKALHSKKFSPDTHFLMAKVYYLTGFYDYAQMELKLILKNNKFGIFGHKDEVYKLLADTYLKSNQLQEAYQNYLILEKMTPEEYNVLLNLGKILIKIGDYQKAIEYFNRALKARSTDASAIAGLGISYYYLNDYEKARYYLEQATQLDRKNYEAHFYLAELLFKKELYDHAITEYEKAIPDKELKLQSLGKIGECYQKKEILTKAIEYYEMALEYAENEAEKLRHNYEKANEYLSQPFILQIRYNLAECYLTDKNFAGAMEQWQEIVSLVDDYKDVRQKIQQNLRYGKDRIQDFLIAKEMEFEKISRYIVQYLGYIIKKLEMKNKEEIYIVAVGEEEGFMGKTLILIKRSFNPVGERDVDNFYKEMQSRKIEQGLIISAMGITPNAIKCALNKPIEFLGKHQMSRLLKKYEMRI